MPELLQQRARQDEDSEVRTIVLRILAEIKLDGIASRLFSNDLDAIDPFLDPWDPLPPDHVGRAAEEFGLNPEALGERISEYSRILGWDLLQGLGAEMRGLDEPG